MPEASEIKLIIKYDPNLIVFDYLSQKRKERREFQEFFFYKIFRIVLPF
jgi:hypothetical protein